MFKIKYVMLMAALMLLFPNCSDPVIPTIPNAPDGVAEFGSSSGCIIVRWNDNSNNEDQFVLTRYSDPAGDADFVLSLGRNTELYSDTFNIEPEASYYYAVYAVNEIGNSDPAELAEVVTPAVDMSPLYSRIADHRTADVVRQGLLSVAEIQQAKDTLHIAYGHTSHGSQIADGMAGLASFANGAGCGGAYSSDADLFAWSHEGTAGTLHLYEGDGYGDGDLDHDCGYYPNWVDETRTFLGPVDGNGRGSAHSEFNVIIWSWCGQASGYDEQTMIDCYLDPMNQLESDYPGIVFVYMTCHLDGGGSDGSMSRSNEQIRDYCAANNKWLFDFNDIESFNPDGIDFREYNPDDACNYSFDGYGDHNWAIEWQESHSEGTDWYNCGSAHSQALNANLKAYAAWWLWARIAADISMP